MRQKKAPTAKREMPPSRAARKVAERGGKEEAKRGTWESGSDGQNVLAEGPKQSAARRGIERPKVEGERAG